MPWLVGYVTSKEGKPSWDPLGFPSPSGCTDINSRQGGENLGSQSDFWGPSVCFAMDLSRAFCWVPYHWGIKWCTGSNLKPKRCWKILNCVHPLTRWWRAVPFLQPQITTDGLQGNLKTLRWKLYICKSSPLGVESEWTCTSCLSKTSCVHTQTTGEDWSLELCCTSCMCVSFSLVFPSRWAGPRSVGILHGGPLRP